MTSINKAQYIKLDRKFSKSISNLYHHQEHWLTINHPQHEIICETMPNPHLYLIKSSDFNSLLPLPFSAELFVTVRSQFANRIRDQLAEMYDNCRGKSTADGMSTTVTNSLITHGFNDDRKNPKPNTVFLFPRP